MSAEVETKEPALEGAALVLAVTQTPEIVLLDETKRQAFFAEMQAQVDAFQHDLSTEAGRGKTKSFAYKITRSKTAVDNAGKALTENARKAIQAVNDNRKAVEERFDQLATDARQPLTDWEEAEAAREQYVATTADMLQRAPILLATDTSVEAETLLAGVEALTINVDGGMTSEQQTMLFGLKRAAVDSLKASIAKLKQQETEAAELAQLRTEKAIRDAAEAVRAREESERLLREAAAERAGIAEAQRVEQEAARAKAEAERLQAARKVAEEKAAREAVELEARLKREAAERAEKLRIETEQREARLKKEAEDREAKIIEDAKRREREAAEEATRKAKAEADRKDREHAAELARIQAAKEASEIQIRADYERRNREAIESALKDPVIVREVEAITGATLITPERQKEALAAAVKGLTDAGISVVIARKVIAIIVDGRVPNIEARW